MEMDLWGLGILLHYLLIDKDPVTDFGLALTYANQKPISWPPHKFKREADKLCLYGQTIIKTFRRLFNEGRLKPNARPTAEEWETLFVQAQKYIYECNCEKGKPFIPLNDQGDVLAECPKCHQLIMPR